MNQDKIQVCIDTLQFDQIEEILYINSFACINLSLYTPFAQHCFKNRRQVSQFQDYSNFMQTQGFQIYTPPLNINSWSSNQSDIKCNTKIIKYLNALIDEILKRYDLMSKQSTLELLGLNDPNIELTTKEDRIIPQKVMGFTAGNNGLTICCIKLTNEFVGLTSINRNPLQNFGKMYSLVEPELMGSIQIYKNQSVVPFTKLYDKSYCFKLNCLEFVKGKNEIVAGSCQGTILLYQIIYFNGIQIQECQSIQLITDQIFRINLFLEQELYLNTENQIKIIDTERYNLIGGGSVKQRLQNGWITTQAFDTNNLLLFLGSNKGIILIYKRTEKLEFVNQIEFNDSLHIPKLIVQKNYLYPCTANKIPIFRYAYKDNKFKYEELTVLQTPSIENIIDLQIENSYILGISVNSTILQWNLNNGNINQAYSINQSIIFYTAFHENKLYIPSKDDKLHIIEFD